MTEERRHGTVRKHCNRAGNNDIQSDLPIVKANDGHVGSLGSYTLPINVHH